MAEVASAEGNFLTSKWGPVPVWVWAMAGLVIAWAFAKYRDLKSAAAAAQAPAAAPGATASSESQQVAPQFLIENNMPTDPISITAPVTVAGVPSAPVPPATPAPPVVTPPSTAPKPPVTSKPPAPKPTPKPPLEYKVHHGDTLSGIAAKYGTTWQKLFTFNTTPGVRPASTIAELKKRGPSLLYANETILIPQ
ncbi:LysM domain-containing protein [Streptomyces sp. NPDC052000]|uniref:LysM peptidoglycan-binding domain-containing protein n=1 Tax=Streptomyces sp. NPDC052000 TaxID=3155676 RepID=UPI00344D2569